MRTPGVSLFELLSIFNLYSDKPEMNSKNRKVIKWQKFDDYCSAWKPESDCLESKETSIFVEFPWEKNSD